MIKRFTNTITTIVRIVPSGGSNRQPENNQYAAIISPEFKIDVDGETTNSNSSPSVLLYGSIIHP